MAASIWQKMPHFKSRLQELNYTSTYTYRICLGKWNDSLPESFNSVIHPCNNNSSSFLVNSVFGAASSLSTAAYEIAANTWHRSWYQTTCQQTRTMWQLYSIKQHGSTKQWHTPSSLSTYPPEHIQSNSCEKCKTDKCKKYSNLIAHIAQIHLYLPCRVFSGVDAFWHDGEENNE